MATEYSEAVDHLKEAGEEEKKEDDSEVDGSFFIVQLDGTLERSLNVL